MTEPWWNSADSVRRSLKAVANSSRFTQSEWPQFQQIGRVRPDLVLLDLLQQAGLVKERVDLFGFSGGAQLAHRFAMLYPHRVGTLHLAAPGWYTLPDTMVLWPLGLKHGPTQRLRGFDAAALSRLQLRHYLALKVRLWVGALDTAGGLDLRGFAGPGGEVEAHQLLLQPQLSQQQDSLMVRQFQCSEDLHYS